MGRALAGRVARRSLASAASGAGPPPSSSNPLRYGGPILPALPIGILSGSLGSIVGIGGALVAVPTTQAAYGLAQLQANSTALLPNVATCLSGAAVFASAGHVDPVAGILVASAATATAGPGARLAHTMNEKTRRMMFAGALLALAPVIALKTPAPASGEDDDADHDSESSSGRGQGGSLDGAQGLEMPPLPKVGYYLALGAAVGAASGMLGIGAGTMMSVGLALAGGMPHKTMLGTSFVAQIGPGLSGAWAHHRLGNLRLDLVPALAVGAGLGSYAASGVAVDLPEAQLRVAFAAFIAGLGMHALRGALKMPKV